MNVSYSIFKAKNIRDIIETISIYNAFLDGNATLLGKPLNSIVNSNNAKRYDESSLKFWKKVLEIEKFLGVEFIPPQDSVDSETICIVEQLYQNLIKKNPIRSNQIVNSVNIELNEENLKQAQSDQIKSPLYFEFEIFSSIELFGIKTKLPSIIGIFNAIISDYDISGQKLILEDESQERTQYTTIMTFKNENDLHSFKTKDHNERISLFHDAKRPTDYL